MPRKKKIEPGDRAEVLREQIANILFSMDEDRLKAVLLVMKTIFVIADRGYPLPLIQRPQVGAGLFIN